MGIEKLVDKGSGIQCENSMIPLAQCLEQYDDEKPDDLLYYIGSALRQLGMNHAANIFLSRINVKRCSLRLEPYMIQFEKGIVGFYTFSKESGQRANNDILWSEDLLSIPERILDSVSSNQFYYWTCLPRIGSYRINPVQRIPLEKPSPSCTTDLYYHDFNPCIFTYKDKLWLNIRSANYDLATYKSRELDKIVRTKNMLYELKSSTKMNDNLINNALVLNIHGTYLNDDSAIVQGIEDLRLFEWQNALYGIGNVCDYAETVNRPQVMLFRFPCLSTLSSSSSLVENDDEWKIPFGTKIEKNWSPVIGFPRETESILYIVYSVLPDLILLGFDTASGTIKTVDKYETIAKKKPNNISWPRGSGCYFRFTFDGVDGFLGIIHEVQWRSEKRQYIHRFVWFDNNVSRIVLSERFFIHEKQTPIEYVLGWTSDIMNSDAIHISYGVEDEQAWVASVSKEMVCEFLSRGQVLPLTPSKPDPIVPLLLCINMDRSADRRAYIEDHLRQHNLLETYRRIRGVDGSQPKRLLEWPLNRWTQGRLRNSEQHQNTMTTALVFSHVRAIEEFFSATTAPHALIIEDDADFIGLRESRYNLKDIIASAPTGWELLHLSSLLPMNYYDVERVYKDGGLSYQPIVIGSTTLAYVISRSGAEKILRWFYSIPAPKITVSDVDIYVHVPKESAWMVVPPIVLPRKNNDSLIHSDHIPYQTRCQKNITKTFYAEVLP